MEDADRVAATQRLVPGGSGSGALDRLAALAARLLGASAAQVSLLTDEQTVAGGAGLAPGSVGGRNPVEESMCTVTVRSGGPLVVEDAARDERVARLPPVASGQVGAYLGVPLLDVDRRMVGALCVFDPLPRPWSAEDVAVLTELAAVAASELELAALSSDYDAVQLRLELAMDAAGIGSWDLDLTSGKLSWDDRLLEMFGYDADSFDGTLEAFYACVHPDDLAHVTREVQSAIDTSGDLEVQYRTVLPSGEIRWVVARGRCLLDSDGAAIRLVGAADDRTQERDGATRVARVLETMPAAFLSLDRDWRFSYVNAKAEELIGRPRDEVVGGIVWELFPDAVGSAFETGYRTALSTGRPVEFEEYYPPPLDRWFTVLAWPGPGGLSVYFHDGTARRRALEEAERARAESENAAARIDLLGEVSAQLAAERESHGALERLVRLVVPALADWCVVVVLDEKGQPSDTAAWHGDPPMLDVVQQLARIEQTMPLPPQSSARTAFLTGTPVTIGVPAAQAMADVVGPGPVQDLITQLDPEHGLVLPLTARGRTLGLLSLFSGAGHGPLDPLDLATANEVARRAALSLDNIRLYRQQRNLAETLQRSMLTAPPQPDHVQIVVRYVPAAEEAQVGGDWYDAFLQRDGSTVLAIGDVVGHDTASAAAMGQVRGLLRGIAYTTDGSPSAVLSDLDRAISGLQVDTTASAVVLRIEQTVQEWELGRTRVRWSNAGHLPPMVLHPDGAVTVLTGERSDLLLGIDPDSSRGEWEVEVRRGATVLLYTDGLVERRGESLSAGIARLHDILAELGEEPALDELCDDVLGRMLPADPQDDVAIVAVRLHPQDVPRPAEAGPARLPPHVPADPSG